MNERMDHLGTEAPLLLSKIAVPRQNAESVLRSRLIGKLDRGLAGKLTLILAPAGFGKTTLAAEWIRQSKLPAAWVSLDARDNAGARLWRYIAAAIGTVRPGFLAEVMPVLSSLQLGGYEHGLILFLNALSRLDGSLVLCLDDFHTIENERLLQGMAYFIEYLPPQIHLCLLSRSGPGIPLSRLEARQMAVRIEEEDLRFTEEEGISFLHAHQPLLDEEQAALLVRRTEGWITGLKLAALSLQREGEPAKFTRTFAGDNRHIRQFLMEEIFLTLPVSQKEFLLKTSILKRWNASLCHAVTGDADSRQQIDQLEKSRLFVISLDPAGAWYRYHHLFSDFLQQQLKGSRGEEVPKLYEAAGNWCLAEGLEEEAVEYFLLGGHFTQAVVLMEKMASGVVGWEWSSLGKWLSVIPTDRLLRHPVLFFSYVNSLVAEDAGDIAAAERLMKLAEEWLAKEQAGMTEEELHLFLALKHYVRGTMMVFGSHDLQQAKAHYERVLHYAPQGIRLMFGQYEKPLQPITVKTYKIGPGHASRHIAEAYSLQLAELYRLVNPLFLGRLLLNLAEMRYYWNDLAGAAAALDEAVTWIVQKKVQVEYDLLPAWILQSKLKAAAGRLPEALDLLERGRDAMREKGVVRGAELLELALSRLELQHGKPGRALEWMRACRYSARDRVSIYELCDYELFVRLLVREQRHEEASLLLDKLIPLAERELRPIDQIELLSMRAALLLQTGEREEAMQQLEEGLRIAEAGDLVRILIDEGDEIKDLLGELAAAKQQGYFRGPRATSLQFIRSIFSGMGSLPADLDGAEPLAVLLTAREMDVYQGLLDGLSGKQIAEKLNISPETVKTHRSRIYDKLGASSKDEAIRRAMELDKPAEHEMGKRSE
ncbi:LuxR C-terminal-related transcriptional regulator [Paenibacillus caui]|uniref:LuxR C-terminal-related transcriptional regulator n=1 Tax=Paenibacillus caui TaxID=2873927 RepID=UPI001CA97AB1|nr:LuxR C-terminal-related transcriptional regulator [Paenibacillus caui]